MPARTTSQTASSVTITRYSLRLAVAIAFPVLAVLLTGCGKTGSNSMSLKWPGVERKEMPVKSSYAFGITKTFTDINNKVTTAPSYRVYAASYDLDAGNFSQTMDKPLPSDDHIRVTFSLVGDQGGNEKSPLKGGDYSAKADQFLKVEEAGIITRKDGKDNTLWLARGGLTGNVKVTSVSGDSLTGEVDLTDGASAIKGPFTAKILLRK